jgi:surfactin synthase thioesterase subunit
MPGTPARNMSWIRRFRAAPTCSARLVCLPHAGGSATFFLHLAKALAPETEVLAVQYPGRQDRLAEPAIETIPGLADEIFGVLQSFGDRPLALFGHSMGALVAYELALRLQDAGRPPVRLFASGRRAPSRYRDDHVYLKNDAQIVASIRALNGTSTALLNNPGVLATILPAVRADYRATAAYRHEPGRAVNCPVTVLTGDADPQVSPDEARAWREHTKGPLDLAVFPGGHFFLVECTTAVITLLTMRLPGSSP